MKVVVGKRSIHNVEMEYKMMLTYQERDGIQSVVFPVVANSYHSGFVDNVPYAGYLLAQEGDKCSSRKQSRDSFDFQVRGAAPNR